MLSVARPLLQEPRVLQEGWLSLFLFLSEALRHRTPRLPLRDEEMWEITALELRGVRTCCLPTQSSLLGLFCLSFETLISRRWKPCAFRRLWPCHFRELSRHVRAPSFICLAIVLMLSANSFLFFGKRLLI